MHYCSFTFQESTKMRYYGSTLNDEIYLTPTPCYFSIKNKKKCLNKVCVPPPHKLGVLFVLANYSWAQGLFCNWLMYPKSLPWKKKLILPLVEGINDRWLLGWKWNFVLTSSFSCWDFCLSWAGPVCGEIVMSSRVYLPCCHWKMLFP